MATPDNKNPDADDQSSPDAEGQNAKGQSAKGQSAKGQSAKGQSAKGLCGRGQSRPVLETTMMRLKRWAASLKQNITVLAFAMRDSRTPWFAKAVAVAVVAYAFSPIDLIPDFIPILGFLDELILLPLGIIWAVRLIPDEVLRSAREAAQTNKSAAPNGIGAQIAAVVIIAIWTALALLTILVVMWLWAGEITP